MTETTRARPWPCYRACALVVAACNGHLFDRRPGVVTPPASSAGTVRDGLDIGNRAV